MTLKILLITLSALFLISCSGRQVEIMDDNGKVIGECYAGVDWHFYGMQDTIDYMLYQCAKDSIEQGYALSDKSLLEKDFTLPKPPKDQAWNKKIAMQHYKNGAISEQKLGYILAAIEYEYMKVAWPAQDDLITGKINQAEFDRIVKNAKYIWLGE
jgi:hypothetical protein